MSTMKNNQPFLSVIIPVFNEEKRLNNLQKIFTYFLNQKYSSEIIIVNDGSADKTLKILETLKKRHNFKLLTYSKNQGKGFAIKTGMLSANGKYRLFFDVDLSTPLEEFKRFVTFLSKYDIVIGTRKQNKNQLLVRQPIIRETLGKAFTLLSKYTLNVHVSDFTCGFKCFSEKSATEIFSKALIKRWGFDSEILFLATQKKFKIKEVPVSWKNDPLTKVRFPIDMLRSLKELFLIRRNHFLKKYD